MRHRQHGRAHILQHLVELEIDLVQRQPAGLETLEIQDVVDDGKQLATRAADRCDIPAGILVQVLVGEQVGHAEDGRQRRAQLVAHGSQER